MTQSSVGLDWSFDEINRAKLGHKTAGQRIEKPLSITAKNSTRQDA
jgi:hypothetical protein